MRILLWPPLRWMIKEILEAQPSIIFRDSPPLAGMGVILNPWAGAAIKAEGSGDEDARTFLNIVAAAPSARGGRRGASRWS